MWGMPERRGRKHDVLEPPKAIDCFFEDFNKADLGLNWQLPLFLISNTCTGPKPDKNAAWYRKSH